jgi:hypothetical protein
LASRSYRYVECLLAQHTGSTQCGHYRYVKGLAFDPVVCRGGQFSHEDILRSVIESALSNTPTGTPLLSFSNPSFTSDVKQPQLIAEVRNSLRFASQIRRHSSSLRPQNSAPRCRGTPTPPWILARTAELELRLDPHSFPHTGDQLRLNSPGGISQSFRIARFAAKRSLVKLYKKFDIVRSAQSVVGH